MGLHRLASLKLPDGRGLRPEPVRRFNRGLEKEGRALKVAIVHEGRAERIKHHPAPIVAEIREHLRAKALDFLEVAGKPPRRERIRKPRLDIRDIESTFWHSARQRQRLAVERDSPIEIMPARAERIGNMNHCAGMLRIAGESAPMRRGVIAPVRKLAERHDGQGKDNG